MTSSCNTRPSSDRHTVECWLLEALDDLRNAAALLRATESKLLGHLRTPTAEMHDYKGKLTRGENAPRPVLENVQQELEPKKRRRSWRGGYSGACIVKPNAFLCCCQQGVLRPRRGCSLVRRTIARELQNGKSNYAAQITRQAAKPG